MRKLMLALSLAMFALMGVLMPATASAADGVEFAVAGTLPPRSQLECNSYTAVEICYEKGGDQWWVQDQNSDDRASAGVYWENYRNGSLYRVGACFTSLGKGKWGHCNKNYYENSQLFGMPCKWDRSTTDVAECYPNNMRRYQ